jgi:16S rRNA A1518/A1519 N6-dimethyltransferase RsmA/KsgA/DIM1 with predicted DNA glycosylase/AP lyase activity
MDWYRCYQENFSSADEKFIILNNDYEYSSMKLIRDDFITSEIPFIKISTRTDINAFEEKNRQYMNAMLPIILQDPSVPQISKLIAKRLTAKNNGMSQNQINVLYGMTASERKAKRFLSIINA